MHSSRGTHNHNNSQLCTVTGVPRVADNHNSQLCTVAGVPRVTDNTNNSQLCTVAGVPRVADNPNDSQLCTVAGVDASRACSRHFACDKALIAFDSALFTLRQVQPGVVLTEQGPNEQTITSGADCMKTR